MQSPRLGAVFHRVSLREVREENNCVSGSTLGNTAQQTVGLHSKDVLLTHGQLGTLGLVSEKLLSSSLASNLQYQSIFILATPALSVYTWISLSSCQPISSSAQGPYQ